MKGIALVGSQLIKVGLVFTAYSPPTDLHDESNPFSFDCYTNIECIWQVAFLYLKKVVSKEKLNQIFLLKLIGQGNGVVRLYSQGNTSSTLTAGKVQVYYNGAWGNICGSNSNYATTANTICYQLGYNGAISYNSNTR